MKALTYAIRGFGRELRTGEVLVLLAAVALAVAALTAVGFLTDRIGRGGRETGQRSTRCRPSLTLARPRAQGMA